ncbi:hypothetical protein Ahu01nite_035210 [Winogradskya humida]|uniref:Uncharacterized protein n=1 Tax=Winogradskya humida TaxID=113566 RepID=A0ABQ3ZPA3_9ACTN|nr:hypothetical protein Ahu01nite_035210 [Actinoplanes humidus]
MSAGLAAQPATPELTAGGDPREPPSPVPYCLVAHETGGTNLVRSVAFLLNRPHRVAIQPIVATWVSWLIRSGTRWQIWHWH